jgi:hypothetical protein
MEYWHLFGRLIHFIKKEFLAIGYQFISAYSNCCGLEDSIYHEYPTQRS